MWVKDGFSVVEDQDHLLRGQEGLKGGQTLRIFDPCADHLGESAEEVGAGGRKLIAAKEPTVVSKSLLDALVVEDGQSNGGFPDSPWADEGDRGEGFREAHHLPDQFVAPKTGSWWQGWNFARGDTMQDKDADPLAFEMVDLV